jgi:choline dehydrogenase-like flavoprotein
MGFTLVRSDATRDVVVVGAGSAGAVVAAGLSADPLTTVLLLEAGPDHATGETPPALRHPNFFRAVSEPGRIWPATTAIRSAGRAESLYVRGRGAGGSSSVNGLCAIRGTVDDYERWDHEYGCEGWGWQEMSAAFLRVEDDVDYGGDGLHGQSGPIPLSRVPVDERSPFDRALRTALGALGYPESDDYHAPGATGVSRSALTLRDGRRVSTNDGYLEAARARNNLEVRGDVLVDRVVFDGRRAIGVRTADGDVIGAREVIVCAGAIQSPAILLRSGVGGDDGLAVGANLKEHAATPGFDVALRPSGRKSSVDTPALVAVLRYTSGRFDTGPNDMQMLWFDSVGPDDAGLGAGRLIGAVMRVFSTGRVRLRDADPTADPIVEFQLLSDERDRVRLRECVYRMCDVVRHPAIEAISEGVTTMGAAIEDLSSDDAIDAWLSANVDDYVHAVGTCRMGRVDDPAAVVDLDCRVIGYEGLRVCDASIMPDVPKANTNLTVVAMADILVHRMRST